MVVAGDVTEVVDPVVRDEALVLDGDAVAGSVDVVALDQRVGRSSIHVADARPRPAAAPGGGAVDLVGYDPGATGVQSLLGPVADRYHVAVVAATAGGDTRVRSA